MRQRARRFTEPKAQYVVGLSRHRLLLCYLAATVGVAVDNAYRCNRGGEGVTLGVTLGVALAPYVWCQWNSKRRGGQLLRQDFDNVIDDDHFASTSISILLRHHRSSSSPVPLLLEGSHHTSFESWSERARAPACIAALLPQHCTLAAA